MYQAEQQDISLEDGSYVNLPHICERHQRMMMPLQAPPLLPPPDDFSSTDTTPSATTPVPNQTEQETEPAQPDEPAQTPEDPKETEQEESNSTNVEEEPEVPQPTDDPSTEPSSPVKERHGYSSSSTMSPYEIGSRLVVFLTNSCCLSPSREYLQKIFLKTGNESIKKYW